jgi:hypothetical protein
VERCHVRVRCTTCQRLATRRAPKDTCTRHNCHGTTTTEQPKKDNYDVWLMGRPFVMVSAEEHTAQVPGEIRNRIENDFKSRNGRTNSLVATPTLEMGVNIGALDMALMRNVPPRPANYWQRAGRAGREERMAVVVTYCRRSPHDRYFFDDPLRILGGAIEAPTFNLRNPLMVAKHIRSAILSELLLRSQQENGQTERIRSIIKGMFPLFIRNYLLDEENHFRETPTSTAPLGVLLGEMRDSLAGRLVVLFAQHWPEDAAELGSRTAIEKAIVETADELHVVIRRLHRRLSWARSTRSELHRKKDTGLIEREPDWVHEPTKVAIYLDGMSRGLHGDPNIARKDQIIRQAVELDGYASTNARESTHILEPLLLPGWVNRMGSKWCRSGWVQSFRVDYSCVIPGRSRRARCCWCPGRR